MKQQAISITGGLDLVADKMLVDPGTSQYCLNYEIGQQSGIRRIDGFSRWDGRPSPPYAGLVVQAYSQDAFSLSFRPVGETVSVKDGGAYPIFATVLSIDNTPGLYDTHTTRLGNFTRPVNLADVTEITGLTSGYTWYSSDLNASLTYVDADAVYQEYVDLITQLPGNGRTRIPGLHFFGNKLYAVVDLAAITVTFLGGSMQEGDSLYCASQVESFGTVASVRPDPNPLVTQSIVEIFDYTPDVVLSGNIYWPVVTTDLVAPYGVFDSGTSWTVGPWVIAANVASVAGAASGNLVSSLTVFAGYAYEVTYTVTAYTTGSVTVSIGGTSGTARSAAETYTETLVSTTTGALTFAAASATLSIDNVSARVVASSIIADGGFDIGAPHWTEEPGWKVDFGVATATSVTGSSAELISSLTAVIGRTYRIKYTVVAGGGVVRVSFGGVAGQLRTVSGSYVDIITATGTTALRFSGTVFSGTIDDVEVLVMDQGAVYVSEADPSRAALYSADWDGDGGWTRLDVGRVVPYDEGTASDPTAFFKTYSPAGFSSQISAAAPDELDTGWIGADGWGYEAPANIGWFNVDADALQAQDGNSVVSGANNLGGPSVTAVLVATFSEGLFDIPTAGIIRGIEVRVNRFTQYANTAKDVDITLALDRDTGRLRGDNKANTADELPIVVTAATYPPTGGDRDLWGIPVRPGDINGGKLQVRLQYRLQFSSAPNPYMSVDQVEIKIYYQPGSTKAYVHSPTASPQDQEIEVVHYTVSEGQAGTPPDAGNRKGLLILNPTKTLPDNLKPWQFATGMGVYSQPGGASGLGVLLANLTGDDTPITFPSSYTLRDVGTRYQFSDARPYARDDSDVFFVCSGAEYASMIADGYALPIQTGLLEQYERPTHATWAGNYLALGYPSGTLAISSVGDPLTFLDAASTAAEIGASDRVVGLARLPGDSLGVFTENTIFAIQGVPGVDLQRVTISPSSGAIEYTVTDGPTGTPMFLDYRGYGTIETTDKYGDFARPSIGAEAAPWLIERLQSETRDQAVDRTVVTAYPMRNKRQYRALFADGWQATLTVRPDGSGAMTTQQFYGDWQDRAGTAIRALAVATGVTRTGQDVAFMTFDSDPESERYRYVFRMDNGRSFDGEPIIAQWMSQPLMLGPAFYGKKVTQLGIMGRAYGLSEFRVFMATDFTDPVSDETTSASATGVDFAFGVAPSSVEGNYKCIGGIQGQGEDFTFLFESISASELPHVIQTIVPRFETLELHR